MCKALGNQRFFADLERHVAYTQAIWEGIGMRIDRASLKQTVKARMAGHYGTLFGITLLPLIILALGIMVLQFLLIYFTTGSSVWSFAWVLPSPLHTAVSPSIRWAFSQIISPPMPLPAPGSVGGLAAPAAPWWVILLFDFVATSAAMGVLTWWRHPEQNRSLLSRAFIGFSPRYLPGYLVLFLFTSVLLNWLAYLPFASTYWGIFRLVWLVLEVILQIGLMPAFYLYMDLRDAGQGGVVAAINLSWQLMAGFKGDYFILLLSLLGWFILCVLVVPIFWVVPYAQTLFAAYYAALREQKPDLIPIPV